ncbi:MAG: hypothetical protein LBH81_02390 [Rickettsiales bacterium]|jgi:hypothetical protein|nr:hypothetical protein [Rickettsiales bacterium]
MFVRKAERGASLLDVILTIGIIGISAPFLYGKIEGGAREIREIAYANHLTRLGNAARNFTALNEPLWPDNYQMEIPAEEFFETLAPFGATQSRNLPPPRAVVFKSTSNAGVKTATAYLIADMESSTALSAHRFARLLGPEGGVSEEGGFAYSANGQWSARIPGLEPGRIVLRISEHNLDGDRARFLHRVRVAEQPELNSMETDLGMSDGGRHSSIINAKNLSGVGLEADDASAGHISAELLSANSANFQKGLRLKPDRVFINSLRVGGDLVGARKITASSLFGGTPGGGLGALSESSHGAQGKIIADRTTVSMELSVGNNLVVKPGFARSVSAFAEISAYSLSAPQITAGHLSVGGAAGITVSSDKMADSLNPPLKLGGWSFPNSANAAPEFRVLKIMSWSGDSASDVLNRARDPMEKISSKNWKEAQAVK